MISSLTLWLGPHGARSIIHSDLSGVWAARAALTGYALEAQCLGYPSLRCGDLSVFANSNY